MYYASFNEEMPSYGGNKSGSCYVEEKSTSTFSVDKVRSLALCHTRSIRYCRSAIHTYRLIIHYFTPVRSLISCKTGTLNIKGLRRPSQSAHSYVCLKLWFCKVLSYLGQLLGQEGVLVTAITTQEE